MLEDYVRISARPRRQGEDGRCSLECTSQSGNEKPSSTSLLLPGFEQDLRQVLFIEEKPGIHLLEFALLDHIEY